MVLSRYRLRRESCHLGLSMVDLPRYLLGLVDQLYIVSHPIPCRLIILLSDVIYSFDPIYFTPILDLGLHLLILNC